MCSMCWSISCCVATFVLMWLGAQPLIHSRVPSGFRTTNGSPLEPLELRAQPRDLLLCLIAAALGILAKSSLLLAEPLRFFGPPQGVVGQGLNASGELLALEQQRRACIEPEPVLFDLDIEAEHTRLVQTLVRADRGVDPRIG